jgi:3-hydroxyacyl-[acyl-carrier-protein] dehydratase
MCEMRRSMRFRQLDRIVALEPGDRIKAVKRLRADEEYLKDHFPRFPVMPGVLMLEAMFQASTWLIRKSENFVHAVVTLREARNIKYADFVEPGQELVVTATLVKQDNTLSTLKVQGTVQDRIAASGRLILERYNLADRLPLRAATDELLKYVSRQQFEQLYQPQSARDVLSDCERKT